MESMFGVVMLIIQPMQQTTINFGGARRSRYPREKVIFQGRKNYDIIRDSCTCQVREIYHIHYEGEDRKSKK